MSTVENSEEPEKLRILLLICEAYHYPLSANAAVFALQSFKKYTAKQMEKAGHIMIGEVKFFNFSTLIDIIVECCSDDEPRERLEDLPPPTPEEQREQDLKFREFIKKNAPDEYDVLFGDDETDEESQI